MSAVIDSVFKSGKTYYLHTFSEECKCQIKEKEIKSLIEDALESSFDEEGNSV